MHSFGSGGYVNTNSDDSSAEGFSMSDAQLQLMTRLYGSNAQRLLEIKRIYDPENLFHHNSNIRDVHLPVGHFLVHQD